MIGKAFVVGPYHGIRKPWPSEPADVYEVNDMVIGRHAVLKVLPPELARHGGSESRLLP